MLCGFYLRRFRLLYAAIWLFPVFFSSELGCIDTRIYDDRDSVTNPSSNSTDTESGSESSDTESNSEDTDTESDSDEGTDTGSDGKSTDTESSSDSESRDTTEKETGTTEQLCPETLKERMTIHTVTVDENIHYLGAGYDNLAKAARITLARQTDGDAIAAWLNAAQDTVHITPLTRNFERRADDIIIDGADIGGLIAHDDGFALLTRQPDKGSNLAAEEEDRPVHAAVWVRYWYDSEETLVVPLTGRESPEPESDYSNGLRGSLHFDGERYGAYFEIRGGQGDDQKGSYGDKMVFIDDTGAIQDGGWRFATTVTGTTSLLLTPDGLAAFAFPWSQSGLYIIWDEKDTRMIAAEEGWIGYSGGEFGGVVSLSETNFAVWASRGFNENKDEAEYDTHDVVMIAGPEDQSGEILKLTQSSDIDEINVHVVPYGDDQMLVIWDEIEPTICENGICLGNFGGTYFQLVDAMGEKLSSKEQIDAPPTIEQKIVQFENGDVAYAFVTDTMDYSIRYTDFDSIPSMRTLSIAELTFCNEENSP